MHFWKYILKLKNKCEMWDTYLCLPRLRSAMKIQPRPKGGLIPQPARRAGDPGGSAPPHRPALSTACWDLPLCRGTEHLRVRCSWIPGAARPPRSGEWLGERQPGPPPGRPRHHFAGRACAAPAFWEHQMVTNLTVVRPMGTKCFKAVDHNCANFLRLWGL